MPHFLNFRGYSSPDPLDKAAGYRSYLFVMLVNLVLSVVLLYIITGPAGILYFNGFTVFGITFSPWATMGLELFINGVIFAVIINALRKSSSLVFYLLILLPYFFLDLYIEAHYRQCPQTLAKALWVYKDVPLLSVIKIPALKFLVTLSVDGIIFGPLGLFLARLLAMLVYRHKPYPDAPTNAQYNDLFRKEWSAEDVSRPKRDLAFYLLRILGFSYLAYLCILVLGLAGAKPWPEGVAHLIGMTYKNPALAINTYFKITLMIMLTFIGAYNKRLRFYACGALLCGHAASTVFSLVFHFYGPLQATESSFLLVSAITDGAMIIIFLWIMLKFKNDAKEFAPDHEFPINFSIPMTLAQNLYRVLGYLFFALAAGIIVIRIVTNGSNGIAAVFGYPDPMIGNTVTLYSTLSLISFLLVKRVKLRQHLFNALIVPLTAGAATALLWLLIGGLGGGVAIVTRPDPPGLPVTADWYFVLFALFNVTIITLLVTFRRMYYNVDCGINTLSASASINILAMTGAFFNADSKHQTAVLKSVDQYVGGIRGRKRGLMNLPFGLLENLLNFLYGMHPPFSSMEREEQRYFLSKYFLTNELQRKNAVVPALADFAYQIGLSLNSIVLFANYSYLNVQDEIGYVPPDARDRLQGDIAGGPPPFAAPAGLPKGPGDTLNFKPLNTLPDSIVAPRVTTPLNEPKQPDEVDYLIVGSGAGGATAAYRLACAVGENAKILVVEAGNRYQPLQDFQDSEIGMMKKVYKEGGLQQTKQFTMNMLQGECVGGSTVINNAVCFEMPPHVRKSWEEDYGIDLSKLDEKYRLIANELDIKKLGKEGVNLEVSSRFEEAVKKFNATLPVTDQLEMHNPLLVNHLNNNGDGNWNLGNKRMRKRSMLETYIPWSEARGVMVIANMTAVRFTTPDGRRANGVMLRSDNGEITTVKVRKAVVVAGGAVASSQFLMRSLPTNKNIGKALSCNFAFPVAFQFGELLRAYDGEQITLGALDPQSRSAFETYYNPPASFALACAPFYFDRRDSIMKQYAYMLNFGGLLGSEANGEVLPKADLLNGQAFSWWLGEKDIANIKYAFTSLIKLGQLAGSSRAIIPTKPGIDLELTDKEVNDFTKALNAFPLRITDLGLATAHPQGGNLMCSNGSKFKGKQVVNEHFQVAGLDNVFVADASLFPTSITVNPQWTIMAMSSLAMDSVLKICK